MNDQQLLSHSIRFRFNDFEIKKCNGWWEVWDIIKAQFVPNPNQEYDSACPYNFTKEEAIAYVEQIYKK